MRTNLSSQISLNRVSPKYYKPENAVERSVLTRCEKVPTDIYETMEEGVQHIANEITAKIQFVCSGFVTNNDAMLVHL